MRHAITSILKSVRGVRFVAFEQKVSAGFEGGCSPMTTLGLAELRHIYGGDDGDLPKGGWKAVAISTAA